jgi:hypothetical protein
MEENRPWIASVGPLIGIIIAYIVVTHAVGYMNTTRADMMREARDHQAAQFLAGAEDVETEPVQITPEEDIAPMDPATGDPALEGPVTGDASLEVPVENGELEAADPDATDPDPTEQDEVETEDAPAQEETPVEDEAEEEDEATETAP